MPSDCAGRSGHGRGVKPREEGRRRKGASVRQSLRMDSSCPDACHRAEHPEYLVKLGKAERVSAGRAPERDYQHLTPQLNKAVVAGVQDSRNGGKR